MYGRHQNLVETESMGLVLADLEGVRFGRHQNAVQTESMELAEITITKNAREEDLRWKSKEHLKDEQKTKMLQRRLKRNCGCS